MAILITGANGFVGTNVSRYLTAQGLKCLALDIAGAPEQGAYAARFTWDELEAIPWCEVGAVIHLAGKAHDTKNASDPQSYFDINVGLTTRILSALVHYCESALVEESEKVKAKSEKLGSGGSSLVESEAGNSKLETRGSIGHEGEITHELTNYRTNALKKFIFFSSVNACAEAVEGVLTEEHVPMPQTPYGKSKLEAEREVLKFESSKVLKLKMKDETGNLKLGEEEREVLKFESSKVLKLKMKDETGNLKLGEEEREVLKFESSRVLKLKMKDETGNLKLGEEEREVLKFESSKVLKLEPASLPASTYAKATADKTPSQGSAKVLKCNGPDMQCSEAGEGLSNFRTLELQNFRTYILRPAMIHGPGNKGNLNLLYKVIQKGIPWPLGAFENQRSFTSIENVSRVLEALIKRDVEPGTYQVADDEPLSTNQVIGLIAESLGRAPRTWKIAPGLMRRVARIGDILHLPLNSERLKKLTESYVVSNRKLLRALAWQKMPVSAQEGMRATLIATTKWSQ